MPLGSGHIVFFAYFEIVRVKLELDDVMVIKRTLAAKNQVHDVSPPKGVRQAQIHLASKLDFEECCRLLLLP